MTLSTKKCPRCLANYLKKNPAHNDTSHNNRDIQICNACGNEEALVENGLVKITPEVTARKERMDKLVVQGP